MQILINALGLFEICDYALSADSWNEMENYDDGAKRNPLGYIISTYQTFPGEDNEDLQKTWWAWTGKFGISVFLLFRASTEL